ncbi:MAG: glycerol-3-phosphate 1-O-acyltransferase PlsY [Candidatus Riflebacteria bacterium]|nr:glycerol-3-phosphate 1-O-acyltransferase PlsY [Candidatus Riflebacteria bacterium]
MATDNSLLELFKGMHFIPWMTAVHAVVIGYLLGSIPTAYWYSLVVHRINIFEFGSKNMGATNVHRVLGAFPFAIVLSLDIAKGAVAVLLAHWLVIDPSIMIPVKLTAGAAAVAGHTLSFWVNFRGGKGVATGLGVFLAITPFSSLAAMVIFLFVLMVSGFVSLSSIISAISLPIFIFCFQEGGQDWWFSLDLFAVIIVTFIIVKHRANISRLLRGDELSLRPGKSRLKG